MNNPNTINKLVEIIIGSVRTSRDRVKCFSPIHHPWILQIQLYNVHMYVQHKYIPNVLATAKYTPFAICR